MKDSPLDRLRHHVTGAIERGEKQPVVALDTFTASYIETAMWSSLDDDGNSLDTREVSDIDATTLRLMQIDCERFQILHGHLLDDREKRAGHDFWLTRNGHGAGFWDGDWPEYGEYLTKASKAFGEMDLMIGDDGKIHH